MIMSKTQNQSDSCIDTEWSDNLDRSPASASPFARPNESSTTQRSGRNGLDRGGTSLSTRDSPKRGEKSGRPLGSCISKRDCDSDQWERLRKRDEEILTFDSDRYERGGESYLDLHRGAGVETDGNERIRTMTLLTVVSNAADQLNAGGATENSARTLVASLSKSETNGRRFEAIATAALVLSKDERIARQIRRIDADSDEIQQIQDALERATSPTKRFRVLNNLPHVTDDERVQRVVERRLNADSMSETHGFALKTVVENVGWSQ